jgi:histidinol phosphatase-like PHP family hydrolase
MKGDRVTVSGTRQGVGGAGRLIDLHTHTLLSDGELVPAELARRAEVAGYSVLGFADHVDTALVETVVPVLVKAAADLSSAMAMQVLPGAEVTHCRPAHIGRTIERARALGARVVLVHGETPSEPVLEGTNRAAIEAGCDILAHPGLVTEGDARCAAERGVLLEVSGRKGHSLANGHVVQMARRTGARVIFGSDAHAAGDLHTPADAEKVLACAGLTQEEIAAALAAAAACVQRALSRREKP